MSYPVVQGTVSAVGALLLGVAARQSPATPLGRWVGESHCVGSHPACHEEHVIYQIDSTGPHQITLRGSRVAGADTVNMGPLSCAPASPTEITCSIPAGTWRFSVRQGHLEGLLTLTDGGVMRRVMASRAQSNRPQ